MGNHWNGKKKQFGPKVSGHMKPKVERDQGAHVTNRGKPKTGYLTSARALEVVDKIDTESGVRLAIYRCVECGLWHVGGGRKIKEKK